MPLIVQKFGGASLADLDCIRRVARHIAATRRSGSQVVVVVSAMGSTTDRLEQLASAVAPENYNCRDAAVDARRELDMLLTAGERQTMALLSLAIMGEGLRARSFTGSQVGIITDPFHAEARIQEVRAFRLRDALRAGMIPIVAGFQGVSSEREITTLGRGGSDVTAVALAAVLQAERCELYKDVNGIFTENPAEFSNVKHVPELSFEELSELAQSGAEVIHSRACALADKFDVPLLICSLSEPDTVRSRVILHRKRGTMVKRIENLEKPVVRAITHQRRLVRLSLVDVRQKRRCLHQVVTRLAAARIPVLLFNHGITHDNRFDLSFIIPGSHLAAAEAALQKLIKTVGAARLEKNDNLCSVSIVGAGVGSDTSVLAEALAALHQAKVHLDAFSTSATRLTCFLRREDLRVATAALLARFRLTRRR
ncbi:MAG: aspartate kinase [candidate division WOR-3 bacterium]